jgi:choline monooxygenase
MPAFEIHPEIRKAWTLPSRFYTDEAFFERAKERIFARSWQLVGQIEDFSQLEPRMLLPGFLDEPILLSRTNEGVKCLSNVCTHRGKILVEASTEGNLIRCGYHGRRFSLDGKFLSMPEFEGVEGFPSAADDLTEYALAEWNGFYFVSCNAVEEPVPFLDDVDTGLSDVNYEELRLAGSQEYMVEAHWALYCENYLEGFHIPYVHKGLNEIVDYGSYTTELYRYSSLQTGFDDDGRIAGKYLFIFPNTMLNFYSWGVSVNIVEPISPDRSRIRYLTYVSDKSKVGTGAGGDLHRVEMEDDAVVESVQRGIRSRNYDRGRYSPTREQGTHHFHRLIAEFIG